MSESTIITLFLAILFCLTLVALTAIGTNESDLADKAVTALGKLTFNITDTLKRWHGQTGSTHNSEDTQ